MAAVNATLLEIPGQTVCPSQREAELSALVQRLLGEVAALRLEVVELRQQAGYWKGMFEQAKRKNEKLQKELDRLGAENRQLKDKLFAAKSEKKRSKDRSHHLPDQEEASQRPRGHQPGSPGPRRRDYSHLPVVEKVVELPPNERACPRCGKPAVEMTETEDSEEIEVEVRAHRRRTRRKRYHRTCDCPKVSQTLTAPAPPKLIPKGRYGISVWVHVLLAKFASHRALGNAIEALALYDLDLPQGTITNGLRRLTPLLEPIYEALLARNSQSFYRQADETRWSVFVEQEGKIGYRWWLWAFLGEETTVYRIEPTRSHEVPEGHYADEAKGILMVDRYSAYKAMAQVKSGVVKLVFCWAHVRRDFIAVGKGWPELTDWAVVWLRRIRDLYHLNRQRLSHGAETPEFVSHNAALREAVDVMHRQATEELADAKLRQPCRKAIESLLDHWPGLTRFVDDPKIPMDNNASERTVRGPAMGRKNYYGSGSLWSVCLTAAMFSILATLKQWGLNRRRWLSWYLESCAAAGSRAPDDIEQFLPWNLTADRRAELTTPEATVPINDSS
ncbi:MAG TPA: IS66 family transposase [Thermoguttaceae bacterium]|nr:IS66 family transposase [Thermoguttaceae bacterium]